MSTYIGKERGTYTIDYFPKEDMSKFIYVVTATHMKDHYSSEFNVSCIVSEDRYVADEFRCFEKCVLKSRDIVDINMNLNGHHIEVISNQHLDKRITYRFKRIPVS